MTLTQTLREIKIEVSHNGTDKQKQRLSNMPIYEIDNMTQIAQMIGVKSAINMFLKD